MLLVLARKVFLSVANVHLQEACPPSPRAVLQPVSACRAPASSESPAAGARAEARPYPPCPRCGLCGLPRKRPAGFRRGSRPGTSSASPGAPGHGPAAPASLSWLPGAERGGGGRVSTAGPTAKVATTPPWPSATTAPASSAREPGSSRELKCLRLWPRCPLGVVVGLPLPGVKPCGTASNYQSREAPRREPAARRAVTRAGTGRGARGGGGRGRGSRKWVVPGSVRALRVWGLG